MKTSRKSLNLERNHLQNLKILNENLKILKENMREPTKRKESPQNIENNENIVAQLSGLSVRSGRAGSRAKNSFHFHTEERIRLAPSRPSREDENNPHPPTHPPHPPTHPPQQLPPLPQRLASSALASFSRSLEVAGLSVGAGHKRPVSFVTGSPLGSLRQ